MREDRPPSPVLVDEVLWVVSKTVEFAQYDFVFETHFPCHHPHALDQKITAIARMGSAPDYSERYSEMARWNIHLINSPDQYQKSSLLPNWYPKITEFTPRSICYDSIPTVSEITNNFDFPIFVKGERQTNRHSRSQSIIESKAQLQEVIEQWSSEKILWWQRLVCREFHRLRLVTNDIGDGLPKSYEFRTFWFYGNLVGVGRYWISEDYEAKPSEIETIKTIGEEITERLKIPFLVIDFAETEDGEWIVIECNDGQDSGYAGVNAREMWREVIRLMKG